MDCEQSLFFLQLATRVRERAREHACAFSRVLFDRQRTEKERLLVVNFLRVYNKFLCQVELRSRLQFCNFSVSFSAYIVWPSVLSLNDLKLHQKFIQEKLILGLTFNPGLPLNGF